MPPIPPPRPVNFFKNLKLQLLPPPGTCEGIHTGIWWIMQCHARFCAKNRVNCSFHFKLYNLTAYYIPWTTKLKTAGPFGKTLTFTSTSRSMTIELQWLRAPFQYAWTDACTHTHSHAAAKMHIGPLYLLGSSIWGHCLVLIVILISFT